MSADRWYMLSSRRLLLVYHLHIGGRLHILVSRQRVGRRGFLVSRYGRPLPVGRLLPHSYWIITYHHYLKFHK